MSRPPARDPAQFVPAAPPVVVRDTTLQGQPVLLLGWWVDGHGKPVEVEVASLTSRRRSFEVSSFPRPPRPVLKAAPGAFEWEATHG